MNDEEKNSYIGPLIRQVSRHTLNGYNELRLNEKLCDASLILDNGEIYPIHRSLLSGSSDYFRILFNTLHEKQCEKIHLRSIESSTIEQILQYIYVSQVDICYDNVLDIMQTADYLRIDGLVQLCYELLTADYMGPDNCVTLLQFADDYFFSQLVKATYKYIIKEFINIVNQDNDLMKLKKEEFIRIIQDNQLNVKREECVWEILIKWIDVDPDNRTNDLAFLLPGIRFGLMNIKYFVDNVQTHHYIKNRADCAPYITEAYTFLCNPASFATNFLAPTFARPRYPFEVLFAIGGWSGGSPTGIIETYDIKSNRWTQIYSEDPLGPRSYHGTLVMNHDIYVIGGFDGLEYFSSCRKFNTITKTWSQIAPMNSKRCYVSVVMLNNIIYAMGGYNSQYRLNSVEKYDFKRNQWTMVAPMIFQRSDACATVLNNRIYVTGGFDGQTCMNTAEVYNVETNEWTLLPQMSTRRSGVCCVAYHGLLYVLGGFDGSSRMNSCEKYDPATCRWSTVADMRNPRSNFGVEVLDDTIFAAGGFNGVATIALVERYDDRTDRWSNVKSMRVYRSALSACVLKDLPNVEHYVHPYKDKFIRKDGKTIERNSQPGDYNNAAIDENHSPAFNADRSNRHRLHIIHEDNEVPANRHPGE